MTKVIVIGCGGHGKVIADIIEKSGDYVFGFLDDSVKIGTCVNGIERFKVIGKVSECEKFRNEETDLKFIVAIGHNQVRRKIAEVYDLPYYTAIHPSSIIGINVLIGEGTAIMAGSIINPCTRIGKHCIINTGAIVEHDNQIQDYVHISPNVSLGGTVRIEEETHVGIGASVKNNILIAKNNLIGAGAVVTKDLIKTNRIYVGIPAIEKGVLNEENINISQ